MSLLDFYPPVKGAKIAVKTTVFILLLLDPGCTSCLVHMHCLHIRDVRKTEWDRRQQGAYKVTDTLCAVYSDLYTQFIP